MTKILIGMVIGCLIGLVIVLLNGETGILGALTLLIGIVTGGFLGVGVVLDEWER